MEEQERIQNEINALNEIKTALDLDINQRNATIIQLDTDIASRTSSRESLNTEISTLTNTKNELEVQIAGSTSNRHNLDQDCAGLKITKDAILEEIKKLESLKTALADNLKALRETSDLFSNDIAGIGEDSKKQRSKYALGIGLSFISAIVFMWILVCSIKGEIKIADDLKTSLGGNPRLIFFVFILIRISIVGSLFVLIFVFINLTRGFVSQFIRTQEKMTAVRLLDFLVNKIAKESTNLSESEKVLFETKKLEKLNELLNKHLPELIEYNPTSFDRLSKTKSPEEMFNELLKSGKIAIPKIDNKPN